MSLAGRPLEYLHIQGFESHHFLNRRVPHISSFRRSGAGYRLYSQRVEWNIGRWAIMLGNMMAIILSETPVPHGGAIQGFE
jgi:hypothetical protein